MRQMKTEKLSNLFKVPGPEWQMWDLNPDHLILRPVHVTSTHWWDICFTGRGQVRRVRVPAKLPKPCL